MGAASLQSRPLRLAACLFALAAVVASAPSGAAGEPPEPAATEYEAQAQAKEEVASPPEAPVDERRTTHRFVSNLGRNMVGMFARDNLIPFAIGAGATGLAVPFDDNVERYFAQPEHKAKWLGDFTDQLGKPYILTPIAAVLYVAGRMAPDHKRFHEGTYDIAQVFLVSAVYTTSLKYATHRERPDGSDHLSFPSGHTSNAFAWATVANHHYGPKLGIPSFALATLIGVGRMEMNVHHLSDVVAGATLGYLVGRTVVRRDSEPVPGTHPHQLRLSPTTGPGGRGMGLTASLEF